MGSKPWAQVDVKGNLENAIFEIAQSIPPKQKFSLSELHSVWYINQVCSVNRLSYPIKKLLFVKVKKKIPEKMRFYNYRPKFYALLNKVETLKYRF